MKISNTNTKAEGNPENKMSDEDEAVLYICMSSSEHLILLAITVFLASYCTYIYSSFLLEHAALGFLQSSLHFHSLLWLSWIHPTFTILLLLLRSTALYICALPMIAIAIIIHLRFALKWSIGFLEGCCVCLFVS